MPFSRSDKGRSISETLNIFEGKIRRGIHLNGSALKANSLPSDMYIAGFEENGNSGRQAAVLIPIVDWKDTPKLVFTKRPESMKVHPGQISFPGGRREEGDKTLIQTALREAHEEVGLNPEIVEIIGRLSIYKTITEFEVTPVIGVVRGPFQPKPDPLEVDEVFSVPLEFFLEPKNLHKRERLYQGKPRPYYYFDFEDYHIWGATAAMLINFREALWAFVKE